MLQTTVVLVALLAGVLFVALPYDSAGGVVMLGAVVVLISIIIFPRLAPKNDRRFLGNILILALIAKMAATGFRLFMNNVVYGGGDLNRFDTAGAAIAERIRSGDLSAAFDGFAIGTASMELLVGIVYSITGTSFFGLFLLSGFMGFLGSMLFYRAFRLAFPSGNYRIYTVLIFFYPAVLYWPTGFGKDVIVFLMLGLTVWGAALVIVRSRLFGLWIAIFGMSVMFLIRPEIGLMAAIAFITAFVLRTPSRNRKAFTIQLIGVPLVLMAGFIAISQATSFLGINDLSLNTVLQVLTDQSSQVFDEGRSGSNFVPPTVGTPTWIPEALMTVLFRPYPWEVHNVPALVQSFDSTLLAGIMLLSFTRLIRSIRSEGQNPIFIFSIVFILMTVVALGSLGNFGLLARQRVIVLPFLFFLISAAPAFTRKRPSPAAVAENNPNTISSTPTVAAAG